MRILLVTIQFPPDTNTTGQLMLRLCGGLVRLGHEVTVLTSFPHYENFRVWDEYRGKVFQRSREHGMEIMRLLTYAPGKKSMRNRLLNYVTFNTSAIAAGLFSCRQWDLVLCPNGSFFTGLTGWLLGKKNQRPFVYNVQDLYPEVPIRAGQLRNRYAIQCLRAIEKFMYQKAAHITVISSALRDALLSKGVPAEKISIIPNFVDTEFIRPLPKANKFAQQNGLSDKFVVLSAGNLGYVYDFDTMLDAAKMLCAHKDILFLVVGNGVRKTALEKKVQELKVDNVRFMPFQPYDDLPWLRASSDVQVSLYGNGAATESFPSKLYEIMASGRPLLASADAGSQIEQLVHSAECGLCVSPGDAKNLAASILKLYEDPSRGEAMGKRGRQYAQKNHSLQSVVADYHELLQKIACERPTTHPLLRPELNTLRSFTESKS